VPPFRATALLAALTAAAAVLPTAAYAADAGPRESLVLQLAAAPDRLLPAAATRAAAEDAARGLGLRVDGSDATSVRVSGPAASVSATFPPADERRGAVRVTPAAFASSVALVVDPGDRTAVASPHATFSGSDFAAAYGAPVPGGYPRVRPSLGPQTPVIATLQLSGWEPELLTRYARDFVYTGDAGYDPVASAQYVGVPVDRPERWNPRIDTDAQGNPEDDGDGEVALDQEALLAAAPAARQRAYFATNSAAGYLAALNRVLADVASGLPIVAFSTSWGSCEPLYAPSYLLQVEDALRRLSAAGVTLFAASGDDGLADCSAAGNDAPAVDYPASSPQVVGVGGTSHPNGPGSPAPDTAWSSPARQRGSGGGVSTIFARPSWQAAAGFGPARQVPDLALVADLATGFGVYTAAHDSNGNPRLVGPDPAGGTSLSAPLAAAMLTNVLTARGFGAGQVRGLGDIHRALYAAALGTPGAFTDVVAVTANTPLTIAPPAPGYDRSTGLGTPNWSALAPALFAPAPPAPSAPPVGVPALSTGSVPLRLAPVGPAVLGYYVDTVDSGCAGVPVAPPVTQNLPEGVTRLFVRALSPALVCSPATVVSAAVGRDDRKAVRSRGWALKGNGSAFAGTYLESNQRGATASWSVTGRSFAVLLDTSRASGVADILLDGRVVRRVDLARTSGWATRVPVGSASRARHTVTVRVLGQPGAGSRSAAVRVDGLLTLS